MSEMPNSAYINSEPSLGKITDFVIDHIDNYDELNPVMPFMRDEAFRKALTSALSEVKEIKLKPLSNAHFIKFTAM
jgi:hypothetical protein